MAFYKKVKLNGKWYVRAVTIGDPFTIDDVADRLSQMSTVSRADTYAVLVQLGEALGELMSYGRSVKIKGVGTFYLSCQMKGKGTDTPEEITQDMISDVKVCFIPEYSRQQSGRIASRTLIDKYLEWVDVDAPAEE